MNKILASLALALGLLAGLMVGNQQEPVLGSVEVGNQYEATTTPAVATATNLCPQRNFTASSTTGVLGSVNITESGAGTLTIYDATTTNVNLRSADQSTTSIRMAHFGASPTESSYHFDIGFKRGLLVDYTTTGTGVSSSTISFRCEG